MEHSGEYIGLLAVFVISAAVVALMTALNAVLGPKRPQSEVKKQPFECGVTPFDVDVSRRPVKFYLIAMLFILFDVEIVWFFPWAVVLRELKWAGLWGMFFFMGVLLVGFIYAWKKGALEWER